MSRGENPDADTGIPSQHTALVRRSSHSATGRHQELYAWVLLVSPVFSTVHAASFALLADLSHARSMALPASELPRRYERQHLRGELLPFFCLVSPSAYQDASGEACASPVLYPRHIPLILPIVLQRPQLLLPLPCFRICDIFSQLFLVAVCCHRKHIRRVMGVSSIRMHVCMSSWVRLCFFAIAAPAQCSPQYSTPN